MSKMIQGSIDDANFEALSESMESAGTTSADAIKQLQSTVQTECDGIITAVNALTKAIDFSNIITQLKAISDNIAALNKED